MKILILFVEHEYQHLLDAVDLTEGKTKSFGQFFELGVRKYGDVNKLINKRIVAAYSGGKVAFKQGIETLSEGRFWLDVKDFKHYCEVRIKDLIKGQKEMGGII